MIRNYILILGLLLSLTTKATDNTDATPPNEKSTEKSIIIESGKGKFKLVYSGTNKSRDVSRNENNKRALQFKKFNFNPKTNTFEHEVLKDYQKGVIVKEREFYNYGQLLTFFDDEFKASKGHMKIDGKEILAKTPENAAQLETELGKALENFESTLQNLAGKDFEVRQDYKPLTQPKQQSKSGK